MQTPAPQKSHKSDQTKIQEVWSLTATPIGGWDKRQNNPAPWLSRTHPGTLLSMPTRTAKQPISTKKDNAPSRILPGLHHQCRALRVIPANDFCDHRHLQGVPVILWSGILLPELPPRRPRHVRHPLQHLVGAGACLALYQAPAVANHQLVEGHHDFEPNAGADLWTGGGGSPAVNAQRIRRRIYLL